MQSGACTIRSLALPAAEVRKTIWDSLLDKATNATHRQQSRPLPPACPAPDWTHADQTAATALCRVYGHAKDYLDTHKELEGMNLAGFILICWVMHGSVTMWTFMV